MMRPPSYRVLLSQRDVGRLLLSASLARLAERILTLVLVLYALARFHSPLLAGWIGFLASAPGLLVSPLAGVVLDRVGSAVAIAVDMALSAACVFAVAMLAVAGTDTAWSLSLLVALLSLTKPLSYAGVRSLLPTLVTPEAFDHANALDSTIQAVVEVVGPALGGALFGLAGAVAAFSITVTLYAAASIIVLRAANRSTRPTSRRPGILLDAAAGVVYVLRHRSLRALALTYACYQVSWGILLVAVPVAVTRALGGTHGDVAVGILWAMSGLAGGIGALATGHLGAIDRERRIVVFGILGTAIAIYPLSTSFGFAGLATGLALLGFFSGPIDVAVLTLRQRRTEPAWLGRAIAVSMSLNMSGLPLGSALGGILSGWSTAAAFAAAAGACLLASAVAWLWLPVR
jgi:MFS family permease